MLNIKHFPTLDTEAALEHYKSEGAKYVCTTELKPYGVPADVFYRPTPHPVYGKENLGLSGALEKCENTNYSNEQALLDIIEEVFNETK